MLVVRRVEAFAGLVRLLLHLAQRMLKRLNLTLKLFSLVDVFTRRLLLKKLVYTSIELLIFLPELQNLPNLGQAVVLDAHILQLEKPRLFCFTHRLIVRG